MNIRLARLEDAQMLFEWKNDLEMRRNAGITREVSWEEHNLWLTQRLNGQIPTCILTIAEMDEEPIGTVRSDDRNGVFELSYSVALRWRRKKLSIPMVRQFVTEYLPGKPLMCVIKVGLVPSEKVAQALGLRIVGQVPPIDPTETRPSNIWR